MGKARMLATKGNKIVYADDTSTEVRLCGVNIAGGEWVGDPGEEYVKRSVLEVINNWSVNIVRLAVGVQGWFGDSAEYPGITDGGKAFRRYIDDVVHMADEAGIYILLDLHHYVQFDDPRYIEFWQQAAERYKNHPAVLFGILNEPHDTTWEIWHRGNGAEIKGHQDIIEMIRDLGAKNIIVAGGLDWAYDLTGITGSFRLIDCGSDGCESKSGNGIILDAHIYPWKGRGDDWNEAISEARRQYPVIIGECGWDNDTSMAVVGEQYFEDSDRYHTKWCPELFEWMNDEEKYGSRVSWTAWCFHPNASPRILEGYDNWFTDGYVYKTTSYWGDYVREQLDKDSLTRERRIKGE